ncbi:MULTISPECIES: S1C family serine protease [unclassified Streptomyces]|uniref:S1C family serine protease n=1 Tax=unclassified Streptomyces TaxID=2593676 RepID=UPI002E2D7324|nr:trypsin-like peptidase domain-containing protein [Streptomyces sp. NBC_00223]
MTESSRNGGEPQYPHDPSLPLYFGPRVPAPEPAATPGPEGYEAPLHESAPAGDAGTSTDFPASADLPACGDPAGTYGDYPPPPAFPPPPAGPGYAALAAGPAPHARRKARGPVALLAAVAVAAGVIGGGAGALIGNGTDHSGSVATASAINASSVDGSIAGVAKAVSPSVVEINATSNSGKSTGAGIIITANGQIVTNNHVIAGADSVSVRYSNGKTATASVVGTDPAKDLALIKVQGASGLPAVTLGDSSRLVVGDQVVAIGSPEGLAGTVTSGIVSALNRDVTVSTDESQGQQQQQQYGGGYGGGGGDQWPFSFGGNQYNGSTGNSTTTYKAIQTDASLNPGNSGGALINMSGQIVGINSAMYADSSSSGGSSSAGSVGLGFAIPINTVKADLAHLRAGGGN